MSYWELGVVEGSELRGSVRAAGAQFPTGVHGSLGKAKN